MTGAGNRLAYLPCGQGTKRSLLLRRLETLALTARSSCRTSCESVFPGSGFHPGALTYTQWTLQRQRDDELVHGVPPANSQAVHRRRDADRRLPEVRLGPLLTLLAITSTDLSLPAATRARTSRPKITCTRTTSSGSPARIRFHSRPRRQAQSRLLPSRRARLRQASRPSRR